MVRVIISCSDFEWARTQNVLRAVKLLLNQSSDKRAASDLLSGRTNSERARLETVSKPRTVSPSACIPLQYGTLDFGTQAHNRGIYYILYPH